MTPGGDIWAVVPVKEFTGAKQRLAGLLSPAQRSRLARVMLSDVLGALAATRTLAGILMVTRDPEASSMGREIGARIVEDGADQGHTGSVMAGIRILVAEGRGGMMTMPGDVPAVTAAEIEAIVAAHRPAPAFTIAPAHDDMGSNAVICSPPMSVPLRFGDNSFFPHLDAARAQGVEPTIVRRPGIAMDIDHPVDLAKFLDLPESAGTRSRALLEEMGVPALLAGMAKPSHRSII